MAEKKKLDIKALMEKANEFQLDDINNIDWENMGSWPLLGKVFFCALLFLAISVGGYFYVVVDEIEILKSAQAKEETLKKDFESKAFRVSNFDAYKAQLEEMEETFGSLLKQLPRDTEIPGLLDDISAAALGTGLSLNLISPQRTVHTEFYSELPISIEVVGGYHEMGAFVSAVASLPRIVTLHDYSIVRMNNSNKDLKMNILAKTYQYSSDLDGGSARKGGRK